MSKYVAYVAISKYAAPAMKALTPHLKKVLGPDSKLLQLSQKAEEWGKIVGRWTKEHETALLIMLGVVSIVLVVGIIIKKIKNKSSPEHR